VNNAFTKTQHSIKVPDNAHFLFKYWDGECVVYNNLSGETHLIEENSALLLSLINESPKSYTALLDTLTSNDGDTSQQDINNYLTETLAHFQALNLIEITP
jgi:PqqD family protein of HPr-rel-A system